MNKIAQIITQNPKILEITYDFKSYRKRHDSLFINKQHELYIRYENLQDLIRVINKHKIQYWLQGKTMLGIYKYQKLLENDTDEDVGVDSSEIHNICTKVLPDLQELGFKVIRATKNNSMLTVMRKNRYIDICFFSREKGIYYYEQKRFPEAFYASFKAVMIKDFEYSVPAKSDEICKYSYNI